MAFPVIETVADNAAQSGTNWGAQTMPTGIASGDFLLALVATDGANETITFTGGTGGWTKIADGSAYSDSGQTMGLAWREANGTDDALTVGIGSSEDGSCRIWRISGVDVSGTPYTLGAFTGSGGAATTLDVAGITGLTAADYKWLALMTMDRNRAFTSAPTNYQTNDGSITGSGAGGAGLGYGDRDLNATAENPGVFTIAVADGMGTVLMAIHPVAAAANITRDPGKGNADFTGAVPALQTDFNVPVPLGTLSAAGQVPSRAAGLLFRGYAPTLEETQLRAIPKGSGSFQGYAPTLRIAITISVPTGTLTLAGQAPTVDISRIALPTLGTLVLAGQVPTVDQTDNHIRAPPAGTLAATGLAPTVERSWVVPLPTGTLTATGLIPTVGRSWVAAPDSGTLTATGYAPGLVFTFDIPVPLGTLALTGLEPTAVNSGDGNKTRDPGVGTLTVSGSIPSLVYNFAVDVPKGSGTFAGSAPTLLQDLTVIPGTGTLAGQGYAPDIGGDKVIPVPVGSLVATGDPPAWSITVVGADSSLLFTGHAPTLVVDPDIFVRIPVGAISFSGSAPSVNNPPVIKSPVTGVISFDGYEPSRGVGLLLKGYPPTLIQTFSIDVPKGTLSLSGQIPVVDSGNDKTIPVPVGSLTVSGSIPSIERSWTVTPSNATLSASGLIPTLDESDFLVISPDAGAITALGYAPTLSGPTIVDCPVGSLSIGGHAPTCINTGDVRKGGRSSRKRRKSRRLFVEVDNQLFEVSSQQEALELLQRAREVVEEQADSLKTAPVIRVVTRAGTPSQSKVVKEAVKTTQRVVNRAFDRARAESSKRAKVDREIALLMALKLKQEEDEEEALIALLLS